MRICAVAYTARVRSPTDAPPAEDQADAIVVHRVHPPVSGSLHSAVATRFEAVVAGTIGGIDMATHSTHDLPLERGLQIEPVDPAPARSTEQGRPGRASTFARRTFGYKRPSRRTFGWRKPSRRTFGVRHP